MKKYLCSLLCIIMTGLITGCGEDSSAPATGAPALTRQQLLEKYMPDAMKDGVVKIAVIINLNADDFIRQFQAGCVQEAEELGFTIDTFCSQGDSDKCLEMLEQVGKDNYDGVILSHGAAEWAYTALEPLAERGMKIATFDTLPYVDGNPDNPILAGVTATSQQDSFLAELSLMAMIENFPEAMRPLRVVRCYAPNILPLEKRLQIYNRYRKDGVIKEIALAQPESMVGRLAPRVGTRYAMRKILADFPRGEIDAIWAPYDALAKGALDAILEAKRDDIKIFSIDISDEDIRLMRENPKIWTASAAVDPALIGCALVRILATKFAGEAYFRKYVFAVQLVPTAAFTEQTTMSNLGQVINGWGQKVGIVDNYQWMMQIKRASSE